MFKLIATMRRRTVSGVLAGRAHYPTPETARVGVAVLLHNERILRVMMVRNEVPPSFVEWQER